MVCSKNRPIFAQPTHQGLGFIGSNRDGYSITLRWDFAYPDVVGLSVGYNIYYSTYFDDVFPEHAKIFTTETTIQISGFTPGDTIYAAIRATEWDPAVMEPNSMPESTLSIDGYTYPETALISAITDTDMEIPLIDASDFPNFGVVQIGGELVHYTSVDYINNTLYVGLDGRGYYGTIARSHATDGYDGAITRDPIIRYFVGWEEQNQAIISTQLTYYSPEYPFTEIDGYKRVSKDILTTNLTASDESNIAFPSQIYSGYRRTNPVDLFSGNCLGSYIGGEYGCADGYGEYHQKIRGLHFQDVLDQREETLLTLDGEDCILLRRLWTGIRCKCFLMNNEAPKGRCSVCLGVGFVGGYDQYYDPRQSNGRLKVRFDPTTDDLDYKAQGFEQNFRPNCWTLVVPAIKDRDVLIRFDQNGSDEYRYEVLNVNRNKTLFSQSGAQKFQLARLNKTDIIYQFRAIRSTALYPYTLNTTMGFLRVHGFHMHTITISEGITQLSQINETTSISLGHNHPIINGIVQERLGHSHAIIWT